MFARRVSAGLDIGEFAVKYALVEPGTNRVKVLRHAEIMPERQTQNDALTGEAYAERIKAIVADLQRGINNPPRAVCTAVAAEGTVCRYVEMPPLAPRELETAVPSIARKHVPFPMDSVVLTYVAVPQLSVGEKKTGVFFVAVKRHEVDRLTSLVNQCGLEAKRIGVAPLALARELARNHELPRDRFSVLLHVAYRVTTFIALREQYPYYVREFAPAGRSFTYAFQMGNQSTWEAAEQLKRNYDVAERDISLEPFLLRWLDEVKRTIQYFSEQFGRSASEIQRIYLSGGGGGLKGLATRLQETVMTEVVVDEFNRIRLDGEKLRPGEAGQYKLAVGMALEGST